MLSTAFSREPLRPVPEVVFAVLGSDEIVDAFTRQCYIGRVRIHLALLVEWPLDVSTIETAHSISTNERSSDIILNSVICAKYINIKNQLTCLRSRSRIAAYGAWRTDRRRNRYVVVGHTSRRSCSSLSRMHRRSQHPVGGTACCG